MSISKNISQLMTKASYIRKMFEQGNELRKKFGNENVFDYTLGNPIVEPPKELLETLKEYINSPTKGMYQYMSNAGYEFTRQAVADFQKADSGLDFTFNNIIITVGAAGALNVTLKAILDPGDEVIIFAPYFVEYIFYIDNHGGTCKIVQTDDEFQLDINAIEKAISAKTKAIIINTPNNPTGVMYHEPKLQQLGDLLRKKQKQFNSDIFLISDEPYKKIVFDGLKSPSLFKFYENVIVGSSHSKDLAVPGERIGFAAVSPNAPLAKEIIDAATFCNRTLGYVNAPALIQRVVAKLQFHTPDNTDYQNKRNLLYDNLTQMGYSIVKPQGTFYLFPQSPIPDDEEFVKRAIDMNLLVVPGVGFGRKGYFRIAYCMMSYEMIERSLDIFKKLIEKK